MFHSLLSGMRGIRRERRSSRGTIARCVGSCRECCEEITQVQLCVRVPGAGDMVLACSLVSSVVCLDGVVIVWLFYWPIFPSSGRSSWAACVILTTNRYI